MEKELSEKVTVIIPTKDRPADLALAVESVFRQSLLPQEVIIVDQSVGNESAARVEEQQTKAAAGVRAAVKVSYIRDVGISGAAMARNRAMDLADGDIWVFLDDDVYLEPVFLAEVLAVYRAYPGVTGVSGIITNYRTPRWGFRVWTSVFVRGPFRDGRQEIYWKAEEARDGKPIPVRKFGGGLMSFRADAIRELRFDERLRGVADGEDVDFCMNLRPGALLLIAPRARLIHKHSPVGRLRDHWLRRSVRANYYLYGKNWRGGIRNGLCFWWLNIGYGAAATFAVLRRLTLEPWRAFLIGVREARDCLPADRTPRAVARKCAPETAGRPESGG